jgi:heme/copper-type cytochrome/quinol oxidase subunit 3
MIAIVLGILFLGIMAQQFVAVTFDGSQFSSVFHLMVAYHAFHAIVVGMMMMIVRRNGLRGDYRDGHTWSVEGTAKLWYFVFVAWILFYIVLYWI